MKTQPIGNPLKPYKVYDAEDTLVGEYFSAELALSEAGTRGPGHYIVTPKRRIFRFEAMK